MYIPIQMTTVAAVAIARHVESGMDIGSPVVTSDHPMTGAITMAWTMIAASDIIQISRASPTVSPNVGGSGGISSSQVSPFDVQLVVFSKLSSDDSGGCQPRTPALRMWNSKTQMSLMHDAMTRQAKMCGGAWVSVGLDLEWAL